MTPWQDQTRVKVARSCLLRELFYDDGNATALKVAVTQLDSCERNSCVSLPVSLAFKPSDLEISCIWRARPLRFLTHCQNIMLASATYILGNVLFCLEYTSTFTQLFWDLGILYVSRVIEIWQEHLINWSDINAGHVPRLLVNWNEAAVSLCNSFKEKNHLQHKLNKKKRRYISGCMHTFSKAPNSRLCKSLIGTNPLVNPKVVIMWQIPKYHPFRVDYSHCVRNSFWRKDFGRKSLRNTIL